MKNDKVYRIIQFGIDDPRYGSKNYLNALVRLGDHFTWYAFGWVSGYLIPLPTEEQTDETVKEWMGARAEIPYVYRAKLKLVK